MSILQTIEVSKTFAKHTALNKVSITVPEGAVYGLIGHNGAGKTTLIRIITQIIAQDSGTVLFNGQPLKPEHALHFGYLPEERGLYKKMKVGEQALYLAQLKGLSKQDALKRLKYWFEKFEIEGWWHKKIEELSKGMQQKVQFIVTIVHEPKFIIFDEPFSGFDPLNATLLKDEILNLNAQGATIIFSTHNMTSVEEMCTDIALINRSLKILEGKVSDIKQQYKEHQFEIHLLNAANQIEVLRVQAAQGISTNELLQEYMTAGQIVKFEEILPSMNDIFIQQVKQNS